MKSERSILEELSFPSNYMSAYNDIFAIVSRAFEDGVYFRDTFHAVLVGEQMLLRMDGIELPILTKEALEDAKNRLTADQAEIISDENAFKTLLRDFPSKTKAMYWFLIWKYGVETTIIKTQAGTALFALLGENGVYDLIQNPPPQFIQNYIAEQESSYDEDWDEDEEDWEEEEDEDEELYPY